LQVSRNQRVCDHVFKSDLLAVLERCGFCGREIDSEGKICEGNGTCRCQLVFFSLIILSQQIFP